MREAIPPLPQYVFMAWCLVKHRENFTFYLLNEEGDKRDSCTQGDVWNSYKTLVRKSEGNRPHGRQRHREKDNIKLDL
jgi:hypothetical protein